ncbi:hypothetical protein EDC15_10539 [Acetobacter aceti NBRC 14818]|nr:hypothetical protein EDC15_10539 [Acetobacter aceti NBRC 14818]
MTLRFPRCSPSPRYIGHHWRKSRFFDRCSENRKRSGSKPLNLRPAVFRQFLSRRIEKKSRATALRCPQRRFGRTGDGQGNQERIILS